MYSERKKTKQNTKMARATDFISLPSYYILKDKTPTDCRYCPVVRESIHTGVSVVKWHKRRGETHMMMNWTKEKRNCPSSSQRIEQLVKKWEIERERKNMTNDHWADHSRRIVSCLWRDAAEKNRKNTRREEFFRPEGGPFLQPGRRLYYYREKLTYKRSCFLRRFFSVCPKCFV